MPDALDHTISSSADAILASAPDCIKVLSADGVLRFVNDKGLALIEADSAQQVQGVRYSQLWPQEMRQIIEDAISRAVAGEATRVEGYCPTLKGSPRWWETNFQRVNTGANGVTEVIGVTRDISVRRSREAMSQASEERVALEQERIETDLRRMASKLSDADRRTTEFIATLAHELRNPLAPIRTGLQLLQQSGDDPATLGHVREMMERQVGQMVHLIADLLDIARVTSGKMELKRERIDLQRVIDVALEASASLISMEKHSLHVQLPDEPLRVVGDATRLAQIFTNLLHNAAKYTPRGGRIEVCAVRQDQRVVVSVADSGIGIEPDALVPIFDMFTKIGRDIEGQAGGLGIGLNLVRRLVELHGGSVTATSDGPGRGSQFSVTLPLASLSEAFAAAGQSPSAAASGDALRVKVLLVDDNVDAVTSLSLLLELEQHMTRVAHTGVDALRLVAEFKPDIVFLDIGMPGMNGYEVARAIRKMPEGSNPVLVALTGWGAESDRIESKNAGFDEHLTKPADISVIESLLARLDPPSQ